MSPFFRERVFSYGGREPKGPPLFRNPHSAIRIQKVPHPLQLRFEFAFETAIPWGFPRHIAQLALQRPILTASSAQPITRSRQSIGSA